MPASKRFLIFSCLVSIIIMSTSTSSVYAEWKKFEINKEADFRGLCAVSDDVCWVSGSKGTFVILTDKGNKIKIGQVPGSEELDFRDVEAFDDKTAYLLSAGPDQKSQIFFTNDAGQTWKKVWQNAGQGFYDAIAFRDQKTGFVIGDSLNQSFPIFEVTDGINWKQLKTTPEALDKESLFAASGSCLITMKHDKKSLAFVSGGSKFCHFFRSNDNGSTWAKSQLPLRSGDSQGAFSVAFRDDKVGVIVGGDYKDDKSKSSTLATTDDGGKSWKTNELKLPFCSCVIWANDRWIAAGTVGVYETTAKPDSEKEWKCTLDKPINVVGSINKAIWAAGPKSAIYRSNEK